MDPITNSKFSDDFRKFVLQNKDYLPPINPHDKPVKPFSIELASKNKKSKKEGEEKKDK
jgi:hypothetical protein